MSKRPALFGLSFSAVSFALFGWGLAVQSTVGLSNFLALLSLGSGFIALLSYCTDAVSAAGLAKRKDRMVFNTIRCAVILLGLPVFFCSLGSGGIWLWSGYQAVVCGLEIGALMLYRKQHE